MEACEEIISLFVPPAVNEMYTRIDMTDSAHYRTREELLKGGKGNMKVVEMFIDNEWIKLHYKWPLRFQKHMQALYKINIDRFRDAENICDLVKEG